MRSFLRIIVVVAVASMWVGTTAEGQRPNTREGFWIGFGLGSGSVGADCFSCSDERTSALSGHLKLGGTISPGFLLGVESNGWVHSENGINETLGFGSVVATWYPSSRGAFYLKLGFGGMSYSADDGLDELTATAPAAIIGIGYDIRVGANFSLTPYLNSLATSSASFRINGLAAPTNEQIKISLVQFGLGVIWH